MGSDECNLGSSIGYKDASSIITSSTISDNYHSVIQLASSSADVSRNDTMASSSQDSDLRCEERLKIKIGECKRLLGPGKSGAGWRDVYVTINLDREEIFRTSVIERTLNPFFGEEFSFEIPRRFRLLSFYVYDKEINRNLMLIKNKKEKKLNNTISYISNDISRRELASSSRYVTDKVIGKVSINRQDLIKYHNKDHWFNLVPVNEDSEVCGQILFTIKLIDQVINANDSTDKKLTVRVLECDNLTLINGNCDPFVVVTLNCLSRSKKKKTMRVKKIQVKRTKIKKKTNTPLYDESFYLDLPNCSIINCSDKINRKIRSDGDAKDSLDRSSQDKSDDTSDSDRNSTECEQRPSDCALSNLIINLSVYHDGPSSLISTGSTFLGQVNIPLSSVLDEIASDNKGGMKEYTRWHLLQPRNKTLTSEDANVNLRVMTLQSVSTLHSVSDYQSAISTLPKVESDKRKEDIDLGSLRLKINYTSDYVLNSRYYISLKDLVILSPTIKPITSSTAFILGEILGNNKTELASALVKLFISCGSSANSDRNLPTNHRPKNKMIKSSDNNHGLLLAFIRSFGEWEISRVTDPNTIFRGNTLLSKFLDELMRYAGSKYLHETLTNVILIIIKEKKNCEIDINRLKDATELKDNMNNLLYYLHAIFKSIITSVILCPKIMRDAFAILKELSLKYYPGMREISYSVISGFIFLRFFAPAILNPKLFDIVNDSSISIDPICVRTLTLISKTIQMMGNLVSCKIMDADSDKDIKSRSSKDTNLIINNDSVSNRRYSMTACFKEDFMANLQRAFVSDEYIESTRMFLEMISSPTGVSIAVHLTLDRSIVLKDGYLMKKSGLPISINGSIADDFDRIIDNDQRRSRFLSIFKSRNKFRKRYFNLSTHTLSYSMKKSKKSVSVIKWTIPISDIICVQKSSDISLRNQRVIRITYQVNQVLYLKASNCVDEQEWFNVLQRVVISNQDNNQQRLYHPADYIGNQWTCCESVDKDASGCTLFANQKAISDLISESIDADREIARIQSLILSKNKAIKELRENCSNMIKDKEPDTDCDQDSEETPTETRTKLRESVYNQCLIEDPKSFLSTLDAIQSAVNQIKVNEELFIKKEVIDTVYGSKSTPIGDDRYLSLIKKHVH